VEMWGKCEGWWLIIFQNLSTYKMLIFKKGWSILVDS
jgi:hypothetical protein